MTDLPGITGVVELAAEKRDGVRQSAQGKEAAQGGQDQTATHQQHDERRAPGIVDGHTQDVVDRFHVGPMVAQERAARHSGRGTSAA